MLRLYATHILEVNDLVYLSCNGVIKFLGDVRKRAQ